MPAKPRGWWYPWLFVAGMLIVVVVNAVLIFMAVDTFPGLSTEDAYRKGLAYNRTIAAADAQDARGWRLDLTVAPQPPGGTAAGGALADTSATKMRIGDLAVAARFVDRAGQPLSRLEVRAFLVRPLGEGHDVAMLLEEIPGGLYRGTLTAPLGGQWDLRIHARRGDETFQQTRRIVVR